MLNLLNHLWLLAVYRGLVRKRQLVGAQISIFRSRTLLHNCTHWKQGDCYQHVGLGETCILCSLWIFPWCPFPECGIFRNLPVSNIIFCNESTCFSNLRRTSRTQIWHEARRISYLSNDTKNILLLSQIHLLVLYKASKQRPHALAPSKGGSSSKETQDPYRHSKDKRHTFHHVKFEIGLSISFTR
jgi:hypothetical protein